MNTQRTSGGSVTIGLPKYEVIDRDGAKHGPFSRIHQARQYANQRWPGQEQDPERSGKGWDVQVCGV